MGKSNNWPGGPARPASGPPASRVQNPIPARDTPISSSMSLVTTGTRERGTDSSRQCWIRFARGEGRRIQCRGSTTRNNETARTISIQQHINVVSHAPPIAVVHAKWSLDLMVIYVENIMLLFSKIQC